MKSEDKFKALQNQEVIQFIEDNLNTSIPKLILKGSPFETINIQYLVDQIIGRNKAKKKLPTWFKNKNIIYPPKLNLEQTSSEITAHHKSQFISGKYLIDLTGGFGVDDFYLSKKIPQLTYTESNEDLFEIAKYNFNSLASENIKCLQVNSIEYLAQNDFKYDWIYIDPSRRNQNKKVFLLQDSSPNVLEHQELLKNTSYNLMIKTSPMYDIEMGYKELCGIKELHVISIKNEVKELLWIIDWRTNNSRSIKLFNYDSQNIYTLQEVKDIASEHKDVALSECKAYLYEFNSSIMKSGFYDYFANKYNLKKLEKHTNLYTSDVVVNNFPGKSFVVEAKSSIHFKQLKKEYKGKFVNLMSKNMKISTEAIQKKLNCKTGGKSDYLIFAKTLEGNKVLKATKI